MVNYGRELRIVVDIRKKGKIEKEIELVVRIKKQKKVEVEKKGDKAKYKRLST